MSDIISFAPIAEPSARVLVLGSMPGIRSLQANQYYAHPRNAFWPLMADVFCFSAELDYESRCEALKLSHVAVWDVLHACTREGSLDSAIVKGSRVPNDFAAFFARHSSLRLICFNGGEAEVSYNKLVRPAMVLNDVDYIRLPSTSPAHAVSFEKKIDAWRRALAALTLASCRAST